MPQFQKMDQKELVTSELNQFKYYLIAKLHNEFHPLLSQILFVTELLAGKDDKLNYFEELQHLEIIKHNIEEMVKSLEVLVKGLEGDPN